MGAEDIEMGSEAGGFDCPGFGKMFDLDSEDCAACGEVYPDDYSECGLKMGEGEAEAEVMEKEDIDLTREEAEVEAEAQVEEGEEEEDDPEEGEPEEKEPDEEEVEPEEDVKPEEGAEKEEVPVVAAKKRKRPRRDQVFVDILKTGDAHRLPGFVKLICERIPNISERDTPIYLRRWLRILTRIGVVQEIEDGRYQLNADYVEK